MSDHVDGKLTSHEVPNVWGIITMTCFQCFLTDSDLVIKSLIHRFTKGQRKNKKIQGILTETTCTLLACSKWAGVRNHAVVAVPGQQIQVNPNGAALSKTRQNAPDCLRSQTEHSTRPENRDFEMEITPAKGLLAR